MVCNGSRHMSGVIECIFDEDKKISLSMKAVELEENVEPEVSAEDAE